MKRFLGILAILLGLTVPAYAQHEAIQYTPYSASSSTGIGAYSYYVAEDAQVDSVWARILSSDSIGNNNVYTADRIHAVDTAHLVTGPWTSVDRFGKESSTLFPWKVASAFASSGVSGNTSIILNRGTTPSAGYVFSKGSISVSQTTDTGITLLGTTPATGNTIITNFLVTVTDTAGYTSAATVKCGTNASSYNNQCSTMSTPAFGTAAGTLVSPRAIIPPNTPIYFYCTTKATTTSEHVTATVTLAPTP